MDHLTQITFGKWKNHRLEQVDGDYLLWLTNQKVGDFGAYIGAVPAPEAAKRELQRRKKGGISTAISDLDGNVSMGITVEEEEPKINSPVASDRFLHRSDPIQISMKSIDDALKIDPLLKDYIQKRTHQLTFSKWLIDLSKEAIGQGSQVPHLDPDFANFRYLDLVFTYHLGTKTLRRIRL